MQDILKLTQAPQTLIKHQQPFFSKENGYGFAKACREMERIELTEKSLSSAKLHLTKLAEQSPLTHRRKCIEH